MKKLFLLFILVATSIVVYGQIGYRGYENYCLEFSILLNSFIKNPTDEKDNAEVFRSLDYLYDEIERARVDGEEKYKLNKLMEDIKLVKEFIAPISKRYNAHLSEKEMYRLQELFGSNFSRTKLKAKCPEDEIEFVEIRVSSLKMCYFHNISKKTRNGLIIKFYAASGNSSCRGQYGALNGEYTHILNNVGKQYVKVISASVIERN